MHRSVAGILDRQRRRNDQHFGQAILLARSQNHPAQTRIHWKLCQASTCFRQCIGTLSVWVNGPEFLQQMIAIRDRTTTWRINKRKRLDIIESKRLHPQNDARK